MAILLNRFFRKPIYDMRKALNDLEGQRLCRERCCLATEEKRLACWANKLDEKAKQTCPCDLHAKLCLLKEESEYARKANKLIVKRAALECRQADQRWRAEELKAKCAELFPSCD